MILNCLKTKEPYVGPKSDCQISPIFLQFWWVLSYIFRLLSPIFLYFWTPKVLDTLQGQPVEKTVVPFVSVKHLTSIPPLSMIIGKQSVQSMEGVWVERVGVFSVCSIQ